MTDLEKLAARYPGDGLNALELVRDDRDWVVCWSCPNRHGRSVRHQLRGSPDQEAADFRFRHPAALGHVVTRLGPEVMRRIVTDAQRLRKLRHDSTLEFLHNADVKEAFQGSDQSLNLTGFDGLASSATAGWGSNAIDNSTNLYLDYLAAVKVGAVATAPGSDKTLYIFAAGSLNTTDLPATGAASGVVTSSTTTAAALTFPSISTTPNGLGQPVFCAPYPVTTIAIQTPLFSMAGRTGLFLWYAAINFTGFTFPAAGNNTFKYRGIFNTVL